MVEVTTWRCCKILWAYWWRSLVCIGIVTVVFFSLAMAVGFILALTSDCEFSTFLQDLSPFKKPVFFTGFFFLSFLAKRLIEVLYFPAMAYAFFQVVRTVEFSDFRLVIEGEGGQSWWRSPAFYFWWHWWWRTFLILLPFNFLDEWVRFLLIQKEELSQEAERISWHLSPFMVGVYATIGVWILRRLLLNKPRDFGGRLVPLQLASSHTPLPERG